MVASVSMVRDEHDIIEHTLTRLARHVDFLIVADNGSTDGTRDILDALADELPLLVLDDPEPAYLQSEKMTALAAAAAEQGAEWIVPVDADEVWLSRAGGRIADTLTNLPRDVLVAEAFLFDHVATGEDPADPDPVRAMGWRRPEPAPLRKVAVRWREGLVIEQGNHAATFDGVAHPLTVTNALEVRHFPYRSVGQFVSKARNGAAAYAAATELPESVGAHWRGYGRILDEHGEDGIADVFHQWFYREQPGEPLTVAGERQPPLVYDPCP